MKQTAVEWFYIEMENLIVKAEITNMDGNDFIIAKVKLLKQAKAMEKEQMNKNTNFICHGCGTKHTGENDDQMYEVCKQCFINL